MHARLPNTCTLQHSHGAAEREQKQNKEHSGTIGDVRRQGVEEGWDSGVLEGAEVLVLKKTCFDNTAHEAEAATWCQEQGWDRWEQVVCNIRPYDQQHGGVVVFVKRGQSGSLEYHLSLQARQARTRRVRGVER